MLVKRILITGKPRARTLTPAGHWNQTDGWPGGPALPTTSTGLVAAGSLTARLLKESEPLLEIPVDVLPLLFHYRRNFSFS